MQFDLVKHPGGVFALAQDIDIPRINRFKTGETYTVEIKLTRNPAFHRKVMAFFGFCFNYWCANRAGLEHMDEYSQFERFRKDLTILAGFYVQTVRLDGSIRTEAKSLAFASMQQEEFERCYSALIDAAIKHVFGNTKDETILNQLYGFF